MKTNDLNIEYILEKFPKIIFGKLTFRKKKKSTILKLRKGLVGNGEKERGSVRRQPFFREQAGGSVFENNFY